MSLSRRAVLGGLTLVAAGLAVVGARPALGVRRLAPLGAGGVFRPAALTALLTEVVDGGFVRWDLLQEPSRRARLEALYADIAGSGPRSTPRAHGSRDAALAYHLNAYNLLVLVGVSRFFPMAGVADVHGPIVLRPLLGFFWGLRFRLDGRWLSLIELEHEVLLREPVDARIHAGINCASASCPPLLVDAFTAEQLDVQLSGAERDWVRRPGVVAVEPERIVLHPLFGMYRAHFEDHARREGWGTALTDYAAHWLEPERATALRAAAARGAPTDMPSYDWSLNEASVHLRR